MTDSAQSFFAATLHSREQIAAMVERIYGAARPGAVFSEPITTGGYTVITAQEISSGGGFGTGGGFGSDGAAGSHSADAPEASSSGGKGSAGGGGTGMGGGGGAMSRPVAAIIIGPDGVRVEPIMDRTKVAITLITTVMAMAAVLGKMRR